MKPQLLVRAALCAAVWAVVTAPAAADFLGAGPQDGAASTADDDIQTATGAYFSTANPVAAFTLAGWLYARPRHGVPYGDPFSTSPVPNTVSVVPASDMPRAPGQSGVAPTPGAGGGGSSGGGSAFQSPSGPAGVDGPLLAPPGPGALGPDLAPPPSGPFVTAQTDGVTPALAPGNGDGRDAQATPEPAGWVIAAAGLGLAVLPCARALRSGRPST